MSFNSYSHDDLLFQLNTFKTIGGTKGDEEGKTVARNLLAILFTKEVLTKFSWTGISRTTGVEKKEAFHSCCGILNFFTEIVLLADSRWNITKNDNLFKMRILKHAKQINEASKKIKKFLPADKRNLIRCQMIQTMQNFHSKITFIQREKR